MNSITFSDKDLNRFWSKVNVLGKDDCWEWKSGTNGKGYGQFFIRLEGKKLIHEYAHRISWMLKFGDIPEGMRICHSCDNPPCCNPDHYFLGTQLDNMQDASRKGRCKVPGFKGEEISWAKLKEKDVLEIKKLLREGSKSQSEIARNFGVSVQAIHYIKTGRNWAWLN